MKSQYIKYMLLPTALLSTTAMAQEAEQTDGQKVNVAFRSVAAEDLLGGVSVIDYAALTEKNFNTYSLDNMQGYVGGFNGASIWGQSDYLVLVDGVPRSANNIKPDEIAQITFLKGSNAVVLYGSRAAKGAILISTKRGTQGDIEIKVNANTGYNVAKALPQYLGSAEYMTLYNRANGSAVYSADQIYGSYAQENPAMYPNNDYYSDEYIKKAYNRWEVLTEIKGGGERARYYSNIGYYRQGDYLNFGNAKNNYVDRLNVRGNVDMNLADWITAYVNANVTFYGSRSARGANFWSSAATVRPNRLTHFYSPDLISEYAQGAMSVLQDAQLVNGMLLGGRSQTDETNFIADGYRAGKNKYNSRNFQFDAGINFDLSKVLQGLSFKTMMAVDYATEYNTYFEDSYATYAAEWSNFNGKYEIVGLTKLGTDKHTGSQSVGGSTYTQTIDFNAHFDYDHSFGDHNVSAMLLANGYQQSKSGSYHATSNVNLGLLADYNYAHKYYAQFGSALVHSAKLAEGHRNAFNYSATLGYNIAREAFMEDGIFDDLTLSASYSHLNQDIDIIYNDVEYYLYAGNFDQANGAWWDWGGADGRESTQSKSGSNEDLDFVKNDQISVSLQASMFKKSLQLGASFFHTTVDGLLYKPSTIYPSYFETYYPSTTFLPITNFNQNKYYGFEVSANYNKKLGEVELGVGASLTWYQTEATKRDDTTYADTYQYRQGKSLDTQWGYECLGFLTEADLDKDAPGFVDHSTLGQTPAVNDLKYKDQNGDGIIDSKDQVDLGRNGWYGAPLTVGLNLTAKYKGFTLFVLATGGFGGQALKGDYFQIDQEDKYSVIAREYRTDENPNGAYPRLTTGSAANNFVASDFWLYKTDRFDVAKVQLTYECPKSWFASQKVVKGVSAFVNGSNLLTIAPEKDILELNVGSAPQSRFFQAGVNVTF